MNTHLDVTNPQPDSPSDPDLRTRARPDQRWGNWRFNAENLTLAYERPGQADHESVRYIDLERAVTPALLLDMFIQMFSGRVGDPDDQAADPSVFMPKDVSDLLQAIEEGW
jgi:hypothetical protein